MEYYSLSKVEKVKTCAGVFSKSLAQIWKGFAHNVSTLVAEESESSFVFRAGKCAVPTLQNGCGAWQDD